MKFIVCIFTYNGKATIFHLLPDLLFDQRWRICRRKWLSRGAIIRGGRPFKGGGRSFENQRIEKALIGSLKYK